MNRTGDSIDMGLSKAQEIMKDREAWSPEVHGVRELDMTEQLNNNNIIEYTKDMDSLSSLF